MTQPLPTRAQVLETLFQQWNPTSKTETVPTQEALGRVLVRDQVSQVTIPVVRASAMDGVAVQSARFADGPAGHLRLEAGEDFCRADTGDDFDDRFDAVIPIEKARIDPDGRLRLRDAWPVRPGDGIRPRGSAIQAGELLAKRDRPLRSFDLACLAMGGVAQVEVYQAPRVAFLPTAASWYLWARLWAGEQHRQQQRPGPGAAYGDGGYPPVPSYRA